VRCLAHFFRMLILILTSLALGSSLTIVHGQEFASPTLAVISNVAITQDAQRIAIRVESAGHLDARAARLQNPERLVLDFTGARLNLQNASIPGASWPVRAVRTGQFRPAVARVVIDLTSSAPYQIVEEEHAVVVYLSVQNDGAKAPPVAPASSTSDKTPTASLDSPKASQPRAATGNGSDVSRTADSKKLSTGVILVKGAWSGASDAVTAVPEGGSVSNNVYSNPYFRLRYTLSPGWTQNYSGPPPSDSGYYVLAQIRPAQASAQLARGSILITAQDLFFTLTPSTNAVDLVQFTNDTLEPEYKVELPPTGVQFANHSFVRFDYGSPVADLHWHILTTQIRCHAVQFIFTSRDAKVAEELIRTMNTIGLSDGASPAGGVNENDAPVCVKDYANGENVLQRVDPILTEHKFNSIPVRIIIDKEGKVKHIHFLRAFPEQEKAISDALHQWRFKPYLLDGQPAEAETGVMFGHSPHSITPAEASPVIE
jgi:AMIN domain